MTRLVALDLAPGVEFLESLARAFEAGYAVLPLDQRLSQPAKRRLVEHFGPTEIIGPGDSQTHSGLHAVRELMDGDALVMATSGTTGDPRGVVLTHEGIQSGVRASSDRLEIDPSSDWWISCLPLAHVGGLSVVIRSIETGTRLTIFERFDTQDVATEAAKGANLISLVPTLLGRVDASWFRKILLGGSEPPAETPDNVVTTYGMTETCGGVVYNGRPLDGVEIDIGEGGEIRLRCRMLARSYCTDRPTDGPESRFGELPVCDANGWYSTGDCGSIDTNGKLQVNGRITDMIITGGENVWPEPIERVLERRPDISEVAVKGSPDQQWGQRVVAYVVPTKVSTPPTLEQLRETVKDQLPAWYAPKELVLVNEIPRTAIGKVRRSLLGT